MLYGPCTAVGPDAWKSVAPSAAGAEQSPVAILSDQVVYDDQLANNPLMVQYDEGAVTSLVNTGHTVQVNVEGNDCRMYTELISNALWVKAVQSTKIIHDSCFCDSTIIPAQPSLC